MVHNWMDQLRIQDRMSVTEGLGLSCMQAANWKGQLHNQRSQLHEGRSLAQWESLNMQWDGWTGQFEHTLCQGRGA